MAGVGDVPVVCAADRAAAQVMWIYLAIGLGYAAYLLVTMYEHP